MKAISTKTYGFRVSSKVLLKIVGFGAILGLFSSASVFFYNYKIYPMQAFIQLVIAFTVYLTLMFVTRKIEVFENRITKLEKQKK